MKVLFYSSILLFLFGCSSDIEPTAVVETKEYPISEFFNNISVGGGSFSEDESKLLYSSDETGIFNLFEVSLADQSKKQITNSEMESFFAIDYVPGNDDIIYSADKGGNEINHIYLLQNDSTIDLTPGEKEKASFIRWSDDNKRMVISSNKRDPKFFDIYSMNIGEWVPTKIYLNEEGLSIDDLSHDEKTIGATKSITTSENELFLINIADNSKTAITDGTGKYNCSGFSKDNKYFYYTTDAKQDFSYLVKYEISSGNKEIVYSGKWGVMYTHVSQEDKYRVIAINEEGKNTLILRDNKTGSDLSFPEVKDGNITSVNFSKSDKLVRLSVNSSKSPNDLYVYNFETKKLNRMMNSLNPNINSEHLVAAEVVRYKSFDGLEIPAIYYKPLNASKDKKVPALVWVHGGPGGQSRIGFSDKIQSLVNHGYAVLAVNNRGSSGYGKKFYQMDDKNHGDKDLKDCIWAKKWLQSQDYIDADKIGILGGSYGGYMTMAAMTFTPDEFKVGVNIFGVTNWLRTLKSIPPYWESFRIALYNEIGDPFSADSTRLYEISPLFHAENVKNPILVLQGANDPRVLKVESDEIVAEVKKNNGVAEYIVFDDEGHGFKKKENRIKSSKEILKFLDKYLRGNI